MRKSYFSTTVLLFSLGLLVPIVALTTTGSRAPLPQGEEVAWVHAPFEDGTCILCHENDDPASPGAINQEVNDLCFNCHDQVAEMMSEFSTAHTPANEKCTNCHNPHNSGHRALLVKSIPGLCFDCHSELGDMVNNSAVKHDALTKDRSCSNCHNPHAANVDKLLTKLPYDLCISCHNADTLHDDQGKLLTNLKSLVDESHMLHGPVSAKDCSACHSTHGSDNFRLLVYEYPAKFYSGYQKENYALCFNCHESEVFYMEKTATLTRFRDGEQNLHFLHVNKEDRGRTCRACHEVHGSPQDHLIRDGVPYGKSGWTLKINFQQTDNGGTCLKTCHSVRSYDRRVEGIGLK
jgi:predicted CXXCH cytochrome family protein